MTSVPTSAMGLSQLIQTIAATPVQFVPLGLQEACTFAQLVFPFTFLDNLALRQ